MASRDGEIVPSLRTRQIRAVHDDEVVRVYQAFPRSIALPAIEGQRFVKPFRFRGVTTWIKPSFLWTMCRTAWGRHCRIGAHGKPEHPGDTVVLGIDLKRACFDRFLATAQLTHFDEFEPALDEASRRARWRQRLGEVSVLVQWDPDKALDGTAVAPRAIQIGLKERAIAEYVESTVRISDMATTIERALAAPADAERIATLPHERVYPVLPAVAIDLHMTSEP